MHLEQIRSCGHKFLNCTRLEILTHIYRPRSIAYGVRSFRPICMGSDRIRPDPTQHNKHKL